MCFSSTLYVVVFFFFSFTGLLLVSYGLVSLARTVRIVHRFNVNMYIMYTTVCEELNDDILLPFGVLNVQLLNSFAHSQRQSNQPTNRDKNITSLAGSSNLV